MKTSRNTVRVLRMWLLALGALTSFVGKGQDRFPETASRTYSWATIREMPIAGVSISMSPEQAMQALEAGGYSRAYAEDTHAYFTKADARETIWLQFTTSGGQRAITYFTYSRSISPIVLMEEIILRYKLVELVGGNEPTRWDRRTRISGSFPVIDDSFSYASDTNTEARQMGRRCMYRWECKAIRENIDCRTPVRMLRGGSIDGAFIGRYFYITATNDELMAKKLLEDRAFRERDLSKARCFIPRVH